MSVVHFLEQQLVFEPLVEIVQKKVERKSKAFFSVKAKCVKFIVIIIIVFISTQDKKYISYAIFE